MMQAVISATRQRVVVLGSTGSIGCHTLEVLRLHPERFEVLALTAATRVDVMLKQCLDFGPAYAVMVDAQAASQLREQLQAAGSATEVLDGEEALSLMAAHESATTVVAAIVGAAGLAPCLAAARSGKRLLLANKEALVVGGELFLRAVQQGAAELLPIDSEHSAVFQALPEDRSHWASRVDKIILTASGGPFRSFAPDELRAVTPEQACAHPNWVMGRKISVDSATMMNKALEVIEAHYLFGLPADQLEVVIHPQSIIHSMVQFRDGSILAQMGTADMRVPIAYALSWPERIDSGAAPLDFTRTPSLTFEAADSAEHRVRFPALRLAWQALAAGGNHCAILNAANEVAVQAFLDGRLRFDRIAAVNAEVLEQGLTAPVRDLQDLLTLDARARQAAIEAIARSAS